MPTTSEGPHDHTTEPLRQVEEVSLSELGQSFTKLGKQLAEVGSLLENQHAPDASREVVYSHGTNGPDMTDEEVDAWAADIRKRVRETLTGLRTFRRDYERWQRLTAEYALDELNYTQRDVAALLGVATSTINRWAQHPLLVEDYS